MPKLILTPLAQAVASLHEVLGMDKTVIVRDATIQRFEYTYELCVGFMKRYLEQEGVTGMDRYSKKETFRTAWEKSLIRNAEAWFRYLEARNLTVHTYNQRLAEQVYGVAREFAGDAQFLLDQLKQRQGD